MKKAFVFFTLALVLALIVTTVACTSGETPTDTSGDNVTNATETPTDTVTEPETPTETPTDAVTDPETPTETPTDAVTDPEIPTETPTDTVTEPETEPTPTSYTINWVVAGETVATGTTTNAKEEVGKPATDPTLPADGFTYTFAGWSDAVTEGTTVTYTAKFTATWIPEAPIKAATATSTRDGFAVELLKIECSKVSAATLYISHGSAATITNTSLRSIALYTESGACIDAPAEGSGAPEVASAELDVTNAETKQFGDKTGYAVTLEFGDDLANHNGMLYVALQGGQWFRIQEVDFVVTSALGDLETSDDPDTPDDPDDPDTPNNPVAGETFDLSQVEGAVLNSLGIWQIGVGNGKIPCLGEIDLSKYSAAKISFGGDSSAPISGLPIGFVSEAVTFGTDSEVDTTKSLAHATMAKLTASWYDGRQEVTIDLTDVTYSGTVYLTIPAIAGGHGLSVYSIELIPAQNESTDTDPVEPETDPVEPGTDPVEPEATYTINWVVDGETVTTATANDPADQSSKPADPTKATDGTFTYAFAGWSNAVAEGTTVTYTAKFNAKMNLTEAKPTGPIAANFTPVILGNLDLSQYGKVEIIVRFNGTNHNGTTYYNRLVALTSSEAGVVRDKTGDNVATVKDLLAYGVVSADTYLDQKNFDGTDGNIDRHKFVIDLSDVTYNGDVYIASHGGQFWWLHEIIFYAKGDDSLVEPDDDIKNSNLKVSGVFGSCMVLQRDMPIEIWGFSDAIGSTVTGHFAGETVTTQVTGEGTWTLTFAQQAYNTVGQTMTISDGFGKEIVLEDILIGDVWFVSGQSNAEHTVGSCVNYSSNLDIDKNDGIRLFTQTRNYVWTTQDTCARTPQRDVVNPAWHWNCSDQASVYAFSAIGYFFAKEVYDRTGIPQGVVMIAAGGATLSELMPAEVAKKQGLTQGVNVCLAGYYNALAHPFVGMNCKGMLFFQGESEAGTLSWAEKYDQYMEAYVQGMRELWEQDFSLYYVQLCDYTANSSFKYFDMVRVKQFDALQEIPNSTMVVSWDYPSPADLADKAHSPYKQIIGNRLAYAALANEYGIVKESQVSSPSPVKTVLSEDKKQITITFKHVAGGLVVLGKTPEESIGQTVEGFSVGDYSNRIPAKATIVSPNTIVVDVPEGADPTFVNYAYSKGVSPVAANLYASNEFPTPSFSLAVPIVIGTEEEVDPTLSIYTINWVVDGKTVATGTTMNFLEEVNKPADPIKESDDTFVYIFKNWEKTVDGMTVTYTAKFVAAFTWIPETPLQPATATSTRDGFAVEFLELDCSNISAVTFYISHNSKPTITNTNPRPIALYTQPGACIDAPSEGSGAPVVASAKLYVTNSETKQFGELTAYAVTLEFGDELATHNGMLYVALEGGQWYRIQEAVFVAK